MHALIACRRCNRTVAAEVEALETWDGIPCGAVSHTLAGKTGNLPGEVATYWPTMWYEQLSRLTEETRNFLLDALLFLLPIHKEASSGAQL